jgi:hypothetical protein
MTNVNVRKYGEETDQSLTNSVIGPINSSEESVPIYPKHLVANSLHPITTAGVENTEKYQFVVTYCIYYRKKIVIFSDVSVRKSIIC